MFAQSMKMAWKSIAANKMRSFLTMLGIIIGVVSLVVLVSLVSGTTDSVSEQISDMGSNLLMVTVKDDKGAPMKLEDVSALAEHEEIEAAAPVATDSVTATSAYAEETATVYGTTGVYTQINHLEFYGGRFLKKTDVDNHTNVVVINAGFATEVLGRMNVVGETVRLNGAEYRIVGVLAADDNDSTSTQNYEAYVPYTSLIRLSENVSSGITSFQVAASSEETMDEAEAVLEEQMLSRFSQDEDAFTILNTSIVMEVIDSVTGTLSLLLGGIAAISLLVGGIGIMNIMLVSVTERTKEIGIRKAIGAGRGVIMLQFLIEALMISLIGCLLGILFSWLALRAISVAAGDMMNCSLSAGVVWIAVIFSTLIGVVFGIYPANKAAKKKPIDALRYMG